MIGGVVDWVTGPVQALWQAIAEGVTSFIARTLVSLLTLLWSLMDRTTRPNVTAGWFASSTGAPYRTSASIAVLLLAGCLFAALIQGILTGRPMELVMRLFRDLPAAVAGIIFTTAFAQIAIDLTDELSAGIWSVTRERAVEAFDSLALVALGTGAPGFLIVPFAMSVLATLFLAFVLIVRDTMIYLIVALAPLAWAASVWPALASARRRLLEMLAALIFCKVPIALALAVGIGAMSGMGDSATPGGDASADVIAQAGTAFVGVAAFGVAAFMPFFVLKLMPGIDGAVVAQQMSGAPVRAAQQGMQASYYAERLQSRGGGGHAAAASGGGGGGPSAETAAASTGASGGSAAGAASPAAAGGGAAASAAAAPVAAAKAAKSATQTAGDGLASSGRHGGTP
jgi:hypothetical protein